MKAKLIFEGREIEVEISEEVALEVTKALPVEKKKTGYERVERGKDYFFIAFESEIAKECDGDCLFADDECYKIANYYSVVTVAENNARADQLYRQLRRFAVEHRETEIDWGNIDQAKFVIGFGYDCMDFIVANAFFLQDFGQIYFDSEKTAQLAIDTFRDELMWYFTEYKDSL